MTVAELVDQVVRRLSELSAAAPVHWTRPEILDHLNEAALELNLIAGEVQSTLPVALNSTDNVYDLPAAAVAPLAAHVNGKYLHKQSVEHLDNESADWEAAGATASVPKFWCPFGLTKIVVSPRPTTAAGAALQVDALAQPAAMSDAAVPLPFRDDHVQALEDYAVSRAHFKEGGAEFQQSLADYARFFAAAQQLAGRNVFEREPAWTVAPKTETAETTLREAGERGAA